MKRKSIILSFVFAVFFLMLSKINVQAECTLEEYKYTNPSYEGVECKISKGIRSYASSSANAEYTSDLQKIVEILREQLVNRVNTIDLYYHCSEEITQDFFNHLAEQLFQDAVKHTGVGREGDYIKWHCQGWTANASYLSDQNGEYDMHLTYNMSYLSDAYQEEQVNQEVSSLLQSLDILIKTDYQKVKAIYDYICSNISYDYTNLDDPTYTLKYSAYAALINKTSVCQGYSSLFYRLVLDAGVDARTIAGDAGGRHSWNIVKIDGKYYNLDSTWDAGRETYSYFLKNMNDFSDHVRDEEYKTSSFMEAYPVSDESYQESEEGGQFEDYEYKINNNQVIITKYTGREEHVITPTMIDNKPVVGIGHEAFVGISTLKTLTISEGVQFFEGTLAAQDLNLKQVNLPSTLCLGETEGNVFTGCNGLFNYCPELEKISVSEDNPYLCQEKGILYTKDQKSVICCAPKTELGNLILPSTVTFINDDAFSYNETLTSIQIPDGVTHIGYWAFDNCINLENANIPRSLKFLGQYAFNQTRLQSLWIPKEVGGVGITGDRFTSYFEAEPIQKITVEEGNTYYKVVDGALIHDNLILMYAGGSKQKSYTLPDYITSVANYAFCRAENLETIILSNRLKEIPYGAFEGSSKLKEIKIPEGIGVIGGNAFWDCINLQKVYFPQSLTKIEDSVFANVWSITDIYYAGSQEEWEKIQKGNSFDHFEPTYHYNYTYDYCEEYGHSYGEPTYVWSSDYSTVTAKRTCIKNTSHVEEEIVYTTKKVIKEPTCITNGSITYSAIFKNTAFKEQKKTVDGEQALGHDFKKGTCTRCNVKNDGRWMKSGSRWWYRYNDGSYPAGELCKIGNTWYGFDAAGWMQTGWAIHNSTWYYFTESGAMQTGWLLDRGTWYYLSADGKMVTGFITIGGTQYYMHGNGKMATGWQYLNKSWYYFTGSGAMQTGWLLDGGNWYYFEPDTGIMYANQWLNDNYYFGNSGAMAVGWALIDEKWYYFNADGCKITNQWSGNYYLKEDGSMAVNEWVDGGRYFVDSNGVWVPNKVRG